MSKLECRRYSCRVGMYTNVQRCREDAKMQKLTSVCSLRWLVNFAVRYFLTWLWLVGTDGRACMRVLFSLTPNRAEKKNPGRAGRNRVRACVYA